MTQQEYAQALGLSIRAIANYDAGREPDIKSLMVLGDFARKRGQFDLAKVFEVALLQKIGFIESDELYTSANIDSVLARYDGVKNTKLGAVIKTHFYDQLPPVRVDTLEKAGEEWGHVLKVILELERQSGDREWVAKNISRKLSKARHHLIRFGGALMNLREGKRIIEVK
jgi:hypothetical protein